METVHSYVHDNWGDCSWKFWWIEASIRGSVRVLRCLVMKVYVLRRCLLVWSWVEEMFIGMIMGWGDVYWNDHGLRICLLDCSWVEEMFIGMIMGWGCSPWSPCRGSSSRSTSRSVPSVPQWAPSAIRQQSLQNANQLIIKSLLNVSPCLREEASILLRKRHVYKVLLTLLKEASIVLRQSHIREIRFTLLNDQDTL